MMKTIPLILTLFICFASLGQRVVGSSEGMAETWGTPIQATDLQGNTFIFHHAAASEGVDTAFITKINSLGIEVKKFKLKSLGSMGRLTFINPFLRKDNILIAVHFSDSVTIQGTTYKDRPSLMGENKVHGIIGLVLSKDLELLKVKQIAFGMAFTMHSLVYESDSSLIFGVTFSDTVDLRPCGGPLVRLPGDVYLMNQNLGALKLKADLSFQDFVYNAPGNNQTGTSYFGNTDTRQAILAGASANNDTLKFQGISYKSSFLSFPFLFFLRPDLSVKKTVFGERIGPVSELIYGQARNIFSDGHGNLFMTLLNFGRYRFAGMEIGRPNGSSTTLMRLDSAGNGIWQKTFPTDFVYQLGNELNIDTVNHRLILSGAAQDTFQIGTHTISNPSGNSNEAFVSVFDYDGNVLDFYRMGFPDLDYGIEWLNTAFDSSGYLYTVFQTYDGTHPFRADCKNLPGPGTPVSFPIYRRIWLRYGPRGLTKDSVVTNYDQCTEQGQIQCHYRTLYPSLRYTFHGAPVNPGFSFSSGGPKELIVNDASCYADTTRFNFPFRPTLPNVQINGNTAPGFGWPHSYFVEVPDSVKITWQCVGGQISSGMSSDTCTLTWDNPGTGYLICHAADSLTGCSVSDSLFVLITETQASLHGRPPIKLRHQGNGVYHVQWETETPVLLTVMDVQGRQVLAHEQYGKSKVLDLSSFPEGLYLLNLKGKEINATFRVLR